MTGVTGNYVSDSLSTTRAHQGDLRLDWNASANDKLFLRFSIAELTIKTDKTAFPLLPGGLTEAPFRNLAVNWSHVFSSSLINEVLVGYNSINNITSLNDWGGIGNANATYGIPGGQPIAGPERDQLGQRPHQHRLRGHHRGQPPEGLPAQREADLDQGQPRPEVRRPVPALRPAPVLRRQQRRPRPVQLRRPPSPASPSPTSCSTRCRARAVAAATPTTRGRTSRTGSPSSSRTTSGSGPT